MFAGQKRLSVTRRVARVALQVPFKGVFGLIFGRACNKTHFYP
jgi:hypothetical protein